VPRIRPGIDKDRVPLTTPPVHPNDRKRLQPLHLGLLSVLLIAPAIAGWRLPTEIPPWALPAGYAAASALAYFFYAADKRRAQSGDWRVPENLLHLLELAGGWPGAFLAQRRLRHKCSKLSYQIVFWLIVAVHQFAAFDYLLDWRITRSVTESIRG
jgi:uncharacterized membrane protein YsdA (DUF1294 family)